MSDYIRPHQRHMGVTCPHCLRQRERIETFTNHVCLDRSGCRRAIEEARDGLASWIERNDVGTDVDRATGRVHCRTAKDSGRTAMIELATELFGAEYRRIFPSGGDEQSHDEAIESAVAVVVDTVERCRAERHIEVLADALATPGIHAEEVDRAA